MSETAGTDDARARRARLSPESRRVLASLIRLLGDFDRAEEALHDAFAAAVQQWPASGVPANPRAWLVSAGRFKAIDAARRVRGSTRAVGDRGRVRAAPRAQPGAGRRVARRRLAAAHLHLLPSRAERDARIALTLREVCDLTTEQVARAFLSTPPTIAQRIVRAKAKIRDAGSRTRSRRAPTCRSGSTPCSTSCTSCSTRATRPPRATRWCARSSRASRSGSARLLLDLLPDEGEVAGCSR
jgi:RNA polymerase sigma-70 factor (ECF subfamily)